MTTLSVVVTVQDDQGNSASQTGVANIEAQDVLTLAPLVFTPDPAPPGTERTVSTYATSTTGRPLTATVEATGVTFTTVTNPPLPAGAPAGATPFAWTFTA